jgi:hypothetical protein
VSADFHPDPAGPETVSRGLTFRHVERIGKRGDHLRKPDGSARFERIVRTNSGFFQIFHPDLRSESDPDAILNGEGFEVNPNKGSFFLGNPDPAC